MTAAGIRLLPYLGVCVTCAGALFVTRPQVQHSDSSKLTPKTLSASSTSLTDVPTFGAFLPAQCDSNSNVYFHLDTGSYNSGTIMRLEQSSWHPHLYKLPADLAKDRAFFAFSVSPLGKVRLLEEGTNGQYDVFTIDSDTDDVDRTHLQIPDYLWITEFVASEAGSVLLGGYYDDPAPKDMQGKTFLAILEPSGRIRKDFTGEGPGPIDVGTVREKQHDGAATVGPDGNFYFVSGREMLVLSGYGDLVRKFPIPKPEEDQYAGALAIAGDLISVQFGKVTKERKIEVQFLALSALTGEPYGLYVPSEQLGNNCVCFSTRSGYTFLRFENSKLKLLNAPLS